jgi:hypothetical protein
MSERGAAAQSVSCASIEKVKGAQRTQIHLPEVGGGATDLLDLRFRQSVKRVGRLLLLRLFHLNRPSMLLSGLPECVKFFRPVKMRSASIEFHNRLAAGRNQKVCELAARGPDHPQGTQIDLPILCAANGFYLHLG